MSSPKKGVIICLPNHPNFKGSDAFVRGMNRQDVLLGSIAEAVVLEQHEAEEILGKFTKEQLYGRLPPVIRPAPTAQERSAMNGWVFEPFNPQQITRFQQEETKEDIQALKEHIKRLTKERDTILEAFQKLLTKEVGIKSAKEVADSEDALFMKFMNDCCEREASKDADKIMMDVLNKAGEEALKKEKEETCKFCGKHRSCFTHPEINTTPDGFICNECLYKRMARASK